MDDIDALMDDMEARKNSQPAQGDTDGAGSEQTMRMQMYMDGASQGAALMSNVQKADSQSRSNIIDNMRGSQAEGSGAGSPGIARAGNWKLFAGVIVLGLGALAATGLFIGARHFIWGRPWIVTPPPMELRSGPPPAVYAPFSPADVPVEPCEVEIIYPVEDEPIPPGALDVEWSQVDDASSYALEVAQVDSRGRNILYLDSGETSTSVQSDYFRDAGDFRLTLSVLAPDGAKRCSAAFTLHSTGYALSWPSGTTSDSSGQQLTDPADQTTDYGACPGCGGTDGEAVDSSQPALEDAPDAVVQPTPTWDPADDTVDYGACAGCSTNTGDVIVK